MTKEQIERTRILLKATLDILNKCNDSVIKLDVMSTTAVWDDVECDGYCLKDELSELLNEIDRIDVVIEDFGDTYSIVDINGCTIEPDFDSYEEAEMWATDNNYNIIHSFNI